MSGLQLETSFEIIDPPNLSPDAVVDTSTVIEQIPESLSHSLASSFEYRDPQEIGGSSSSEKLPHISISVDDGEMLSSLCDKSLFLCTEKNEADFVNTSQRESFCPNIVECSSCVIEVGGSLSTYDVPIETEDCSKDRELSSEMSSLSQISIVEADGASGGGDQLISPTRNDFDDQITSRKRLHECEIGFLDILQLDTEGHEDDSHVKLECGEPKHCKSAVKTVSNSCEQDKSERPISFRCSRSTCRSLSVTSCKVHSYMKPSAKRSTESEMNWSSWDQIDSCSPQKSIADFLLGDGLLELKNQWEGDGVNSKLWKQVSDLEKRLMSARNSPRVSRREYRAENDCLHSWGTEEREFEPYSSTTGDAFSLDMLEHHQQHVNSRQDQLRIARIPNGFRDRFQRSRFLRKLIKQAKASFNFFLKTLDPGMDEFFDMTPSFKIAVLTCDPGVAQAVQKGFTWITAFVDTLCVYSLPLVHPDVPLQPMSNEHGIRCAEMLIQYARDGKFVDYGEVIVVVIPILAEITKDRWHSTICLFLDDPGRKLTLHLYTQTTPVPNEYVNQVVMRTPQRHHPLGHLGYEVTVGQIVSALNGIPQHDWQAALTDVSCYEQIENAAKALAGMYRNYIDSWIDKRHYTIV